MFISGSNIDGHDGFTTNAMNDDIIQFPSPEKSIKFPLPSPVKSYTKEVAQSLEDVEITFLNIEDDYTPAKLESKTPLCSLSQRSPSFCGVIFTSVAIFLLHLLSIFLVSLPTYFSNDSPFLIECIFEGFNEFPSLLC